METKYRLFIHLDHDEELSEPSSRQFSLKRFREIVAKPVFILFFTRHNSVDTYYDALTYMSITLRLDFDENIFYC